MGSEPALERSGRNSEFPLQRPRKVRSTRPEKSGRTLTFEAALAQGGNSDAEVCEGPRRRLRLCTHPCEMPPERGPPSTTPTTRWAPEVGWPTRSDVRPLPLAAARAPRRRPGLAEPDRSGRGARGGAGRVLSHLLVARGPSAAARVKFTAAVSGLREAFPLGRLLVGGERYLNDPASHAGVSAALGSPTSR